jgi:hypothetical protein
MMQITEEMVLAFLRAWHTTAEETGKADPDDAAMRAGLQAALSVGGVVVLSATVYAENQARLRRLEALEAGGVDNWEGYPHAMSVFYGMDEEDETPEERELREAAEDEAQMFRPRH